MPTTRTEMPILRKALVFTVYYTLKMNDDQGDVSPIKSLNMRRALEPTQYLPTVEEIEQAKAAANDLAIAQLRFKYNGSRIVKIQNITASVVFETY